MWFLLFIVSVIFYIVFYFLYLSANNKSFLFYDFSWNFYFPSLSWNLIIESFLFIALGIIFYIYFSDLFSRKDNTDKIKEEDINDIKKESIIFNSLLGFFKKYAFTIFFTLVISTIIIYFSYNFLSKQIIFYLFYIFLLFSVLVYFYLTSLDFFKNYILKLRVISIFFSYFSILFWFLYLIILGPSWGLILSLFYLCFFNFYIHNKFENYISFFIWIFTLNFLVYFFYYKFFYNLDDWFIFLTLSLFVSLESIIITYFYKFKYKTDYYFFHIFSYIINILSLFIYLFLFKIDLFLLSIIFFVELIYIYLSYYKLRQIK